MSRITPSVPLRLVTDSAGIVWNVWHVTPDGTSTRSSLAVAPQYADGWLAFEQTGMPDDAPAAKRRLAPVPPDWATASDEAVLALLSTATPVQRRPQR